MIMPTEEIKVDKKRLETLLGLISKYISDEYKQFKWIRQGGSQVLQMDLVYDSKVFMSFPPVRIFVSYQVKEKRLFAMLLRTEGSDLRSAKDFTFRSSKEFPISQELPPKEIAKTAQNIFKWIKEEMKKK